MIIYTQGYYSILLYIFIDLHINFGSMTVADCIDFIAFFAFRCNGTTVLAEIHRVIMEDPEKYWHKYANFGDSMYQFLYDTAAELFPESKGVGSCTQPRYTYSAGSNTTSWDDHQQDLFNLCNRFYADSKIVEKKGSIAKVTREVVHELYKAVDPSTKKKKFCGVGAMGAIQFVHLASLLGLIPMHCYTYAELKDDDLGPPRFIRTGLNKMTKSMSIQECDTYMQDMHKELSDIWGPMVTLSLIENMLCELSRSYKATVSKLQKSIDDKSKDSESERIAADIITDNEVYCDGKTVDVTYHDSKRGCLQNFFLVRTQGGDGACYLRPMLVMKISKNWGQSYQDSHITLTNWIRDRHDKKNLWWEERPAKRSLLTFLNASERLKRIMTIDNT